MQHNAQRDPGGVGVDLSLADDGAYLTSKVVEPTAQALVKGGALQAYSIGIAWPKVIHDAQAPGGRIVGGEIVEVSLVDRPANPACKFSLVKSAGGVAEFAPELIEGEDVIAASDAALVPAEKEAEAEVEKAQDAHADSDDDDNDDDASSDAEDDSDASGGDTDAADDDDDDDSEKAAEPEAVKDAETESAPAAEEKSAAPREATWVQKRLHALLCAAYDSEAVKAAFPSIEKDGVAGSLGPTAMALVFEMLSDEVAEDGGTGTEAYDIEQIADVYCNLVSFLQSEAYEDVALLAAHDDMHKAFKEANPSAPRLDPTAPPTPDRWRKPYADAGRSRAHLDGGIPQQHLAIPGVSGADVPSPATFDGDGVSAGQERPSPANKSTSGTENTVERPAAGQAGRVFYTNEARSQAQAAMKILHDHIASTFPDICPMAPTGDEDKGVDGSSTVLDLRADSRPEAIELPAPPKAPGEKAATVEVAKAGAVEPDMVRAMVAEAAKAALAAAEERFSARVEEIASQHASEVTDLKAMIDELGKQPDPNQAPLRGIRAAASRPVERVSHIGKAVEDAETRAKAERAAMLRHIAMADPHPVRREEAIAALKAMGATL